MNSPFSSCTKAGGAVHMVRELTSGHRVILKAVLLPKPLGTGDSYSTPTARWEENLVRCESFGKEEAAAKMMPAT